MSVGLRIRARLPEGDRNGLALLGPSVLGSTTARYLVALVSPVAITENLETGNDVVSLGLEHVELDEGDAIRALLARLYAARTGVTPLPFDAPPDIDGTVTGTDIAAHPFTTEAELAELTAAVADAELLAFAAGVTTEELAAIAEAAGINTTTGELPKRKRGKAPR